MTAHPSWPLLPLVGVAAAAAVLLLLASAIQAVILYVNRARVLAYASRLGVEPDSIQRTVRERHKLVAALETMRAASAAGLTAALLALIAHRFGLGGTGLVLAVLAAAVIVTLLQALPRTFVKQHPERWGFALRPVARVLVLLLGWLEPVFELPARLVFHLMRIPPPSDGEQQEELLRLVELEESTGGIEEEEREMIRGIIGLEDTTVREIMVPRLDIAAVDVDQSISDAIEVVVARGFSRLPLYEENIDHVIGIVYAKDLLKAVTRPNPTSSLREQARPAYVIPEAKRVDELLAELRRARVHIAIVVDEFGGTAGLVTIEDLLEEIVGEIEDEYDLGAPTIERRGENEAVVDARLGLDVLEDLFDIELENPQVDTLGGLVYEQLGRMPQPGDKIQLGDLTITVLSVSGHRLQKLSLVRDPSQVREPHPEP